MIVPPMRVCGTSSKTEKSVARNFWGWSKCRFRITKMSVFYQNAPFKLHGKHLWHDSYKVFFPSFF